ncbi:hypothetical protein N7509_003248 [Penicillium cosmopolitanum]|uniref:Zn(2)-C6 fungal-type domain-containing protein n=1 Tax=Penicillium cosmopolitanum TaxID=1131564 RepID=A0A9X0BBB3_9EURO|nr:uncharacterized protein N7509_003248 [Penicillium cosmopolitanum]KAJ5403377.1 hypothetical protein N7509_003248 [Penicillium cosmopolitanum]
MLGEEDAHASKRRKVRKGTQSCWECKRRKVRCITSHESFTCDNCRRRKTSCIAQDLPDRPVPPACDTQVEDRLSRVESLIEQLIDKSDTSHPPTAEDINNLQANAPSSKDSNHRNHPPQSHTRQLLSSKTPFATDHTALIDDLIAVWPSRDNIEAICTLPVGFSMHLQCCVCASYTMPNRNPPSPLDILQLPPSKSHPVLFARKLLMLGALLQAIVPSSHQQLDSRGISCAGLLSRVIERATRLVTTNDELVRSIEGLECIMIEAQLHNYSGNLHRAWLATHRAVSVAQIMGLHRGLNSPSLKFHEPETRANFDPKHILFRIIEMDLYLSLMLGLPNSSLQAPLATPKALEGCLPIERIQRTHYEVSRRIIQRSNAEINSVEETSEIDRILQNTAAEMSPQWWLMPSFAVGNSDKKELFDDTIRLMVQFSHYHLIIRLHLPYLVRSLADHKYDRNMITAVNASREILSRYIAFRSSNPVNFYCRGSDFLAFVSIVVICFAQIGSHSQNDRAIQAERMSFTILAHSRLSDRGIMERTLAILLSISNGERDSIVSKLSHLIRHLLAVESDAANGKLYSMSTSASDEGDDESTVKSNSNGRVLRIHIPYFGTINFEPGAGSSSVSRTPMQSELHTSTWVSDVLLADQLADSIYGPCSSDVCPLTPNTHLSQIQKSQQSLNSPEVALSESQGPNFNNTSPVREQAPMTSPSLDTSTYYDWDLQGIDLALFDSLFGNVDIPNVDNGEIPTLAGN